MNKNPFQRFLSLYLQHIKTAVHSAIAYRINFLFMLLISLLSNLLLPLVTLLIYRSGAFIPGWTFYEALLIQSVFMLCTGICAPLFYDMVWVTMFHIKEGTYDLFMLKPASAFSITLANSFSLENIGVFLGGMLVFIYSLIHIPAPSGTQIGLFILLFFSGVAFSLGLILLMCATTFKWVGNSRIFEIYDSITTLGRYPGTIFSKLIMNLTTFVIPISMLGFFPASALLGKNNAQMLWAMIPAVSFLFLGLLVYKKMIASYQSAGG